jgi:hypothetical protein
MTLDPDVAQEEAWAERSARTLEEGPDQGPAKLAPTLPGGFAPERGRIVQLPGNNYPPAGAFLVDEPGDANVPAAAPLLRQVVVTINVPADLQLRVDGIGTGYETETAAAFIRWFLFVNGRPVPSYNAFPFQIGSLQTPCPIFLHVRGSAVLTLEADNAATLDTYHVFGRVRGWLFATMEE